MATYNLGEEIDRKLHSIAEQRNRTPQETLDEIIETSYSASSQTFDKAAETNPLLKMAQDAEQLGLSSSESDISDRSREILNEEFPRYLKARMDRDETDPA